MTYKDLTLTVLSYTTPVRVPTVSTNSIKRLKFILNVSFRIVNECHQWASKDSLHAETQLLTIDH